MTPRRHLRVLPEQAIPPELLVERVALALGVAPPFARAGAPRPAASGAAVANSEGRRTEPTRTEPTRAALPLPEPTAAAPTHAAPNRAATEPGPAAAPNGDEATPPAESEPLHAAPPEGFLRVGDLAKATGKTVRAIHLYEKLGLLPAPVRSKGGYRLFTADAVLRVRWISKLQSLDLSLTEIQALLQEQRHHGSAMFAAARLRDIYEEKLRATRAKLRELAELEHELEHSVRYLSTCDDACVPDVPRHTCSACDRHAVGARAPELVAGIHVH